VRNEAVLPIAQFLGRAWSRDPQLQVRLDTRTNDAYATRGNRGNYIVVPPPSRFPSSELITAYRLWRATLWHEAMHHNYGLPTLEGYNTDNIHYILNIVEDYRIEESGVVEYPGMRHELDLRRAVYYQLVRSPKDYVEAYAQLLLLRAVKMTDIPDCVIDAVRYTKEAVEQGVDSVTIARHVCELLGVNTQDPRYYLAPVIQFTVPSEQKIKSKDLKKVVETWLEAKQQASAQSSPTTNEQSSVQEQRVNKPDESDDEVDEAELILTAPSEVKEEIEQARVEDRRIERGRKGASTEVAEGIFLPSRLDVDESDYYNQELITHLVSQLRKLRRGWKEHSSTSGEFDVDSYVARHGKVFVDEEQLKVGGYKVLILVDHSGSIFSYEDRYKTACIALAEGLAALKIPFAIYMFTEYGVNTVLYLIKSFNEKWTRMNAKRLAQIEAHGGTPLNETYKKLTPLILKNKGKLYLITLTDGMPDSSTLCKQRVESLKKHCRMFAVAFGKNMNEAVHLALFLKELGYERYVALDDVKKLPEKVLSLLGG
jgi:nitric oxide reductase activation protein